MNKGALLPKRDDFYVITGVFTRKREDAKGISIFLQLRAFAVLFALNCPQPSIRHQWLKQAQRLLQVVAMNPAHRILCADDQAQRGVDIIQCAALQKLPAPHITRSGPCAPRRLPV